MPESYVFWGILVVDTVDFKMSSVVFKVYIYKCI